MNLENEGRKTNLISYFNKAQKLKSRFTLIKFHQVPRHESVKANAIAGLAGIMDLLEVTRIERKLLPHLDTHQAILDCFQISNRIPSYENLFRDWRELFIDYILHGLLLDNVKYRTSIQRRALRYYYDLPFKTLYGKLFDGVIL